MMEELEIARNIMGKIKDVAESGAVAVVKKRSRQVRFSVNKIDSAKSWDEMSIMLLIEKEKKMLIYELSYKALDRLDELIRKISDILKIIPPKPYYAPLPSPADKYPQIPDAYDKETIEHPEKIVDLAYKAIDYGVRENIKKISGVVYTNAYNYALVTSSGFERTHKYTNTYIDVRAFNNYLETGHASMASRKISNIDPKRISETAAYYAKLSKDPKKINAGEYTTVFTADAVASILNFVGMMASGFAVIAGYSSFVKKLGQKVASEIFSLEDNPHYPDSFYPIVFDDEGVPTRQNVIIKSGLLQTYLHNRITAVLLNAEHTGNAGWIFPHPWNLVVSLGDMKEEEMIENIKEGLLVGNVTYIRFQDYIKGDFSGIIRDGVLYIKDGEVKHAVKGLRLSDNLLRWLQNIIHVGKEQRQIYHWWLEAKTPVVSPPITVDKARYTEAWS